MRKVARTAGVINRLKRKTPSRNVKPNVHLAKVARTATVDNLSMTKGQTKKEKAAVHLAKVASTAVVEKLSKKKGQPNKEKPPVHILLRVRSEDGRTIKTHADKVASKGAALLGKMGPPVGPGYRKTLNQQIAAGIQTYLFLTLREGWNGPYVTYRCPLRYVHHELEDSKRALVPSYYIAAAPRIGTWFEITGVESLTRDQMNRIFVMSSGREIMSVITSSATMFHVGVRANPIQSAK